MHLWPHLSRDEGTVFVVHQCHHHVQVVPVPVELPEFIINLIIAVEKPLQHDLHQLCYQGVLIGGLAQSLPRIKLIPSQLMMK